MRLSLELKKLRRTGFFPVFWGCTIFCGLIPLIHTGFRAEVFAALPGSCGTILIDANWEVLIMLTVLFIVAGACIMYHTEHRDRAFLKMATLPVSGFPVFLTKCLILELAGTAVILSGCFSCLAAGYFWFPEQTLPLKPLFLQGGLSSLLLVPFVVLMLLIASWCSNLWTPLGIGVLLVFAETILRVGPFFLRLLPFSLPYRVLSGLTASQLRISLGTAAGELLILGLTAWILQSHLIRRIIE